MIEVLRLTESLQTLLFTSTISEMQIVEVIDVDMISLTGIDVTLSLSVKKNNNTNWKLIEPL